METMAAAAPPQQRTGGIARRLARLLRRKRTPAGAGMAYSVAGDEFDDSLDSSINSLSKLKLSGNLAAAYTLDAFFKTATEKKAAPPPPPPPSAQPQPQPCPAPGPPDAAAKQAFVASLFAGASAVKAAYAQLQLAQHPYDAEAIQAADAGLVSELTKLSDLKRRYTKNPTATARGAAALSLAAHADEQRHLLRTYEITARKLEAELRSRDAEASRARAALADELRAARAGRRNTLAALDGLHLSGLNATHFLTALRHAVKSVTGFGRALLDGMRAAGWDAAAAAGAVHPGARLRDPAGDARFALESYVALKMFAGFHRKDFGMSALHGRCGHDRRKFFEEFAAVKSAPAAEFLGEEGDSSTRWGALREFLRDRYLSVVHERMEAAFFGGRAEQRAAVRGGGGAFPRTAWFAEFAEMARRVWLLHCLFWAFDGAASVFQARPGERFSEVFMESASDDVDGGVGTVSPAAGGQLAVGFTVVPGFKVGRTVIQCRVYLSRSDPWP
ncbi:unnamed protein product [Urochloa humidicola]